MSGDFSKSDSRLFQGFSGVIFPLFTNVFSFFEKQFQPTNEFRSEA